MRACRGTSVHQQDRGTIPVLVTSHDGRRPVRICLLGAPGDTGNLGVTALLYGTLSGLAPHLPGADVTVFDNGVGVRHQEGPASDGIPGHRLVGLRVSRRYHRPESLANVRLGARLGRLSNPAAHAIASADGVLDISGGDSFSELYSRQQQRIVFEPKKLVLSLGCPLFLMPQTYGPFFTEPTRRTAVAILRQADGAWARDSDSYATLQTLLGDAFDPTRHREGVDVAFRLPSRRPARALPDRLAAWLSSDRAVPVAGLNVSGLLYYESDVLSRCGLSVSYRSLVLTLVRRLLEETDANVLLIPHVLGQGPSSDERAIAEVQALVSSRHPHRVMDAPVLESPGEAKWLIGKVDWFSGARMHATIAALSSGVPTAGLAYSLKMRGVFASCGLGEEVADLRRLDEREALAHLMASWRCRTAVRERLAQHLPTTLATADDQAREIATAVHERARQAVVSGQRRRAAT